MVTSVNKALKALLKGFQLKKIKIDYWLDAERVEKAVATHSSALAWKIPWIEEPGRLQSMGSQRVGHDWATSLSLFTFTHWRRKWQPTPVFLPGESQGRGSLVGCVCGVSQSRTRLKWLSSGSRCWKLSFFVHWCWIESQRQSFGWSRKGSAYQIGHVGSILGSGRPPGEGSGSPLQYSCLGNPMEEEPDGLESMGSKRSQTQLGNWTRQQRKRIAFSACQAKEDGQILLMSQPRGLCWVLHSGSGWGCWQD